MSEILRLGVKGMISTTSSQLVKGKKYMFEGRMRQNVNGWLLYDGCNSWSLSIILLLLHYYLYNCCNNKLEIISTFLRQQELTGPLVSTLRIGRLPGAYRSDPV